MSHGDLYEKAKTTIDELYSDASVSLETIRSSLEALIAHTISKLHALDADEALLGRQEVEGKPISDNAPQQILDEALEHIAALVGIIDGADAPLTGNQGTALGAAWLFKIHVRSLHFFDSVTFLLGRLYNAAARYYVYCVADKPKTGVTRSDIESEFFAALLDVRMTQPQLAEKYPLKSLLKEIRNAQE